MSDAGGFEHVDELYARFLEGELPFGDFLAQHPDHARSLELVHADALWLDAGLREVRETPAPAPDTGDERLVAPPDFEQRFEIGEEIGRGGMGVVLRVLDRRLERWIAMKVLARGDLAADRNVVGRFLEEARITAQLGHPGVVPVHDMGRNPGGQLFFTMELVEGQDLRGVLERAHAGDRDWTRERVLGVLERVCDAVSFAHARGVLHRDLKPGNIMVGAFGEVRVMDWGIARLVHGDAEPEGRVADEAPVPAWRTLEGQVLGTPAYMSPEQAAGKTSSLGPAIDVYAVGAMLYELLGGRPPYWVEGASNTSADLLRRIAIGTLEPLASRAPGTPAALCAICARAMQRSPAERYASVAELGQDLRAWLENRVVRAHASGPWAELAAWVRRNRALAVASAALALALVGGLVVALSIQAVGRRRVLAESSDREHVLDFFTGMFERADPWRDPGHEWTVAEILDLNRERLASELGGRPGVQARLAHEMGRIYDRVGELESALEMHERARALRSEALGEPDATDFEMVLARLETLRHLGREAEAQGELRAVAQEIEERFGNSSPQLVQALAALGQNLTTTGDPSAAETCLRRALQIRADQGGTRSLQDCELLSYLGSALYLQGRLAEARTTFEQATTALQAVAPDEIYWSVVIAQDLAQVYQSLGEVESALALYDRALERSEPLGPRHPDWQLVRLNRATAYKRVGHAVQAEEGLRELCDAFDHIRRGGRIAVAARAELASLYLNLPDPVRARPLIDQALAELQELDLDEGDPLRLTVYQIALQQRAVSGDEEQAAHFAQALREALGPVSEIEDLPSLAVIGNLGRFDPDKERVRDEIASVLEACYERGLGKHPDVSYLETVLAHAHWTLGDVDEAVAAMRRAAQVIAPEEGDADPRFLARLDDLTGMFLGSGRTEEAVAIVAEKLEILRRERPVDDGPRLSAEIDLARLSCQIGRCDEALAQLDALLAETTAGTDAQRRLQDAFDTLAAH